MAPLRKTDLRRIRLTINGKLVLARKGQTILEAARENAIHIPTLCYTEKLKPLGACRLCIVEIASNSAASEGKNAIPTMPVTACTTPVAEGMVVTTDSPMLENLRRETLKLIFLRHPLNCTACEINGSCQLQDLAHEYDISHEDLHTYEIRPLDIPAESYATPLIKYHARRCILCGRCVQACQEISEVGAIAFKGRGASTRIAPVEPTASSKPECISCGECLAICPANALTEAMGRPKGKPWETQKVKTICTYCGCGCELILNVVNNQVVGVSSSDGGVNKGALCSKGRFGYDYINHKDRLKEPMINRGGYWEEVTWDDALDYMAEKLAAVRVEHGADAFGALSSARCTNEENYLFQKLVRGVMGTNNVDHCARL
jgi:predicted molibdopterin-dependent oxidoreductase YjgC